MLWKDPSWKERADKGAAVVVQNRNDYLNKANNQLNGEDQNGDKVYRQVAGDPTSEFVGKVKQAVQHALATNVIDQNTANYLLVEKARPGNIYFVPKIHKPQRPPPARPICNTINSATANISKWVDDQLQPLVRKLPSYLKDDNHFLRKINEINNSETLPADTLLVTWDVKSLYTNITHENGMRACEHYMRVNNYDEYKRTTVLDFIKLVLTCNNLTFQGSHYIQQTGTAMGTRMAPTYANLYMGLLEEQLLDQTTLKPLVWFRFIDDIFFLWTFGPTKLQQFFDACNSFDPHIKFEQTVSSTTIPFLDVQVILDNGKIKTDLYTKPTDTHQYLNWTSCHPRHTKAAIPYSLALRLRRICSENNFFEKRARELFNILLDRGYKPKHIKQSIARARQTTRREALRIDSNTDNTERVPLVVTYNPALGCLNKIIKEYQPVLHASRRCREVFRDPTLISFRKGRNLSDLLTSKRLPADPDHRAQPLNDIAIPDPPASKCPVCSRSFLTNRNLKIHFTRAHKTTPPDGRNQPGFSPCQADRRCASCKQYGKFSRVIESTNTGETFLIRQHITCRTANVIYVITCAKCKQQYVGETSNSIRTRANQHRSDITTGNKNIPTVRHFKACGLQHFQLTVVERVRRHDVETRRARESFWIERIRPAINGQT